MTEEPEDTEPNHKSDEDDLNDDDFLMSSSGMTMGRFRQIQAAEQKDEPLELSEGEREQYEETKLEVAEIRARLTKVMNDTFEPYNQRLKSIIRDSLPKMHLNFPKPDLSPTVPTVKPLAPPVHPGWFESLAEAATEKAEREADNSRNIGQMAAAAQDMLSILSQQKGIMDEQQAAQAAQETTNTSRHRQMMWVMVPTLLATIAALVATIVLA